MSDMDSTSIRTFYGVDLHVHTPASSCYKGNKNDDEYINILKRYKNQNVKVIAITDHNTIDGYRNFIRIKNDKEAELRAYQKISEIHPHISKIIQDIKEDLKLYEDILILPGVEFEALPGIHLLFIFDNNSDIEVIEDMLFEAGYTVECQGNEDPNNQCTFDVLCSLEKAYNLGAITIAAHIDSDKGIYTALEMQKGYRARIFSSDYLMGMSYNNPLNAIKIEGLLKNKEYKRNRPIGFIQSSDYHGEPNKEASSVTYFRMEHIDYSSIYNAFINPKEFISVIQDPATKNILLDIVTDPRNVTFKDINKESEEEFTKCICAILNSQYGSVIIGADKDQLIGVGKTAEEIHSILEVVAKKISTNIFGFYAEERMYKYGNRNIFILSFVGQNNSIYSLENQVYLHKNGKVVKALPHEIMQIGQNMIIERYKNFGASIERRLAKVLNEVEILKKTNNQFVLFNKIEENSFKLRDIVDIYILGEEHYDYDDKYNALNNGRNSGNLYIVDNFEPHYPVAYLRCSCPRTDEYSIEEMKIKKFKGEAIVIVPCGGCFYINNDEEWTIVTKSFKGSVILLKLKEGFYSEFSVKSIVAWLKSSILLWYASIAKGDIDINDPKAFNNLPILRSKIMSIDSKIDKIVCDIIIREKVFLEKNAEIDEADDCEYSKIVDEHNGIIKPLAQNIENMIYDDLNISEEEKTLLINFLHDYKIYNAFYDIDESDVGIHQDEAAVTSIE